MKHASTLVKIVYAAALLILSVAHAVQAQERPSAGTRPNQAFGRPTPPSPVHFENGTSALDIPFRIVDNTMFITIVVNDSVRIEAAFDSGYPSNGVIILDPEIAKQLQLKFISEIPLGGAGDDIRTAKMALGATIEIPGARFTDQEILVVSQPGAFADWTGNGIVGGSMLNSCVVEIDHDRQVINLYHPDHFDAENSGQEFDLSFSMGIPVVDAALSSDSISNLPVTLLFDTGADVPLSIHGDLGAPFQAPEHAQEYYLSEGIAGPVFAKWGRISGLQIGAFAFSDVLVVYPTRGFDEVGVLLGQDGFFGLVLQRRFNITFDYSERKIYLTPSKLFLAPFEFNMAGLILDTQPGGFRIVKDVVQGSSGDMAGIRKGDILISIDNRDVRDISDPELEELFVQEERKLVLVLGRDGKQVRQSLVLKRIL